LREELQNETFVAEMVPSALSDFGAIVRIEEKLAGKFRIYLLSFLPKANEKCLTGWRNENVHHTTSFWNQRKTYRSCMGLFQF